MSVGRFPSAMLLLGADWLCYLFGEDPGRMEEASIAGQQTSSARSHERAGAKEIFDTVMRPNILALLK